MSIKDKFLERSDRYQFYVKEYEKLVNENKKIKNENKQLKKEIDEYKRRENQHFKKVDSLIDKLPTINKEYKTEFVRVNRKHDNLKNMLNSKFKDQRIRINHNQKYSMHDHGELKYAFIFNDTIRESEWLNHKSFSLVNSAANYSLAYSLYRILDEARPQNILELGLGQTSKITSQYANHFGDDVKLTIIESDEVWIENFSKNLNITDNIKMQALELELFDKDGEEHFRFKDLINLVENDKFDLVIIDAPLGFVPDPETGEGVYSKYARSDVWQLIPDNLAEDFIIIMDDHNRDGETNTMEHVKELIEQNDIEFYDYLSQGLKEQYAVFTEKYKYISWI